MDSCQGGNAVTRGDIRSLKQPQSCLITIAKGKDPSDSPKIRREISELRQGQICSQAFRRASFAYPIDETVKQVESGVITYLELSDIFSLI
jgi:hypothetical protein